MSTTAGWYGKIASLGDFASRRLAPPWIAAADRWLAAGVAASQQQLGEQWLPAYLGAPLWRFAWAPGVIDSQWWFGVLMPSCDNVGRYFPLLISTARGSAPSDRFALDHLELWWQRAAEAALETLAEGSELARLEAALQALPPWPGERPAAAWAGAAPPYALPAGAVLSEIAHHLAAAQLLRQLNDHSLWWSWRGPAAASQLRIVNGLPPAQDFVHFLQPAAAAA